MEIPLPDIRTLRRRLQHIKIEPKHGTRWNIKMTLDEVAITPSVELHLETGKLYWDVMLPSQTGEATHACVFMLEGSTTQWKQVVTYRWQFH